MPHVPGGCHPQDAVALFCGEGPSVDCTTQLPIQASVGYLSRNEPSLDITGNVD